MAEAFPLQGERFDLEDALKWFTAQYNKSYWAHACTDFLGLVKQRVMQEGYAPIPNKPGFFQKIEVRLTAKQVQRRVGQLANQISQDYQHQRLTLVGVLNAAGPLTMKLLDALPEKTQALTQFDFVQASSRMGTESTGTVQVTKEPSTNIRGRDVLIVEGVVGTGLTLHHVRPMLETYKPNSIRVCALLDKPGMRKPQYPITVDYRGFLIENRFVVGCGLDLDQDYRGLPYIGVL